MSADVILGSRILVAKDANLLTPAEVKRRYVVQLYDEKTCSKCKLRPERHSDTCEQCPAYHGTHAFHKSEQIGKRDYFSLPIADIIHIRKKLRNSDEEFTVKKDLHLPKMKSKLKFTGKLFGENAVDTEGNPRANQEKIVEEWLVHKNGIIRAQPRTGKCLVGSTLVNTDKGFITLRDLIHKEGYHSTSFEIDTPKGRRKVSHTFKEKKANTIKITTRSGFEIEGTPEHPMLVLTPSLKKKWVKLCDIREGDHIVSLTNKNNTQWGSTKTTVAEATILGMMIANGDTLNNTRAMLSTGDLEIAKQFSKAVEEAFGLSTTVSYSNDRVPNHSIGTEGLEKLHRLGYPLKSGSRHKYIPNSVLTAPREVVHAFLSAYFACDSGVNGQVIELCSASKTLIDQLHVLLFHGFGVLGKKTRRYSEATNSSNPTTRPYWLITFSGLEAASFCRTFPYSKVAQKYSHRFSNTKRSAQEGNMFYVPYLQKAVAKGLKLVDPVSATIKHKGHKTVLRFKNGNMLRYESLTKSSLPLVDWTIISGALIEAGKPGLAKRIARVATNCEHYERVENVKIQRKRKTVYDVTVPDGHSFTANCLASHNTVISVWLACHLGVRTVIIADRFELLNQFYWTFMGNPEDKRRKAMTNAPQMAKSLGRPVVVLVKTWADFKRAKKADVVLINPQKFVKDKEAKIRKFLARKFGMLIVDEIHQAAAKSYSSFIYHLDPPYRLGLSATTERKDGFDTVTRFTIGPVTAESETVTLRPIVEAITVKNSPTTKYRTWTGALSWLASDKERNRQIVARLFADLRAGHKSIIVPMVYLRHMHLLVDMINQQAKYNRINKGEKWPVELAVGFWAKANKKRVLERADNPDKPCIMVAVLSMIKQGVDLSVPSMLHVVIPMSARGEVGAPAFRQLSFRVATPTAGKTSPKVCVWVDPDIKMFVGALKGLAYQEILPGVKRGEYRVNEKFYNQINGGPRPVASTTGWS